MSDQRYPNEEYYNDPAYTGATQMLNPNPPVANDAVPYAQPPSPYDQPLPPSQPNYPMQPYGQPQVPPPYQQPMAYSQPNYYIPTTTAVQRPAGVSLIAVWQFIVAGILGITTLLVLFAGNLIAREFGADIRSVALVVGVIFTLITALFVALGVGLWRMKGWARIVSLIVYGLNVVLGVMSIFDRGYFNGGVFTFLIPVAIVIYLLLPNVAAAFRRP